MVKKPCLRIPTKPDCGCLYCSEWRAYLAEEEKKSDAADRVR